MVEKKTGYNELHNKVLHKIVYVEASKPENTKAYVISIQLKTNIADFKKERKIVSKDIFQGIFSIYPLNLYPLFVGRWVNVRNDNCSTSLTVTLTSMKLHGS